MQGRIVRHRLADRLYHWLIVAAVLTLMGTAFLPILGIKFEWDTIHWVAGLVLAAAVLFHVVRALGWLDVRAMGVGRADLVDVWRRARRLFGRGGPAPGRGGKYLLAQRAYHAYIALALLTMIVTGIMMMTKLDTPFWQRNPYWLPVESWGVVYLIHGYVAMSLITVIMVHIYFAVRPDKWWYLRSMVVGWISRGDYDAHFDPARWPATGEGEAAPGRSGLASGPAE
ncbi:MAG TPA: cytochrome b/b6 domain-containing protein [Hyphomicrobiales bacterium]|nr:cytochrome b/b6 domain-containing protein [Hyphomicrobiales bacterium]